MFERNRLYQISSGTRLTIYGAVFFRILGFLSHVLMVYGFAILMDAIYQGVFNAYLELFVGLLAMGSVGAQYFCTRLSYKIIETQKNDISMEIREMVSCRSTLSLQQETKDVLNGISTIEDMVEETADKLFVFLKCFVGCVILIWFDWQVAFAYFVVWIVMTILSFDTRQYQKWNVLLSRIGIAVGMALTCIHIQSGNAVVSGELLCVFLSISLFEPDAIMPKKFDGSILSKIETYRKNPTVEKVVKESYEEVDIDVEMKEIDISSIEKNAYHFGMIFTDITVFVLFVNAVMDFLNYSQALSYNYCVVLIGVIMLIKVTIEWLLRPEEDHGYPFYAGLLSTILLCAIWIAINDPIYGSTFLAIGLLMALVIPYVLGSKEVYTVFYCETLEKQYDEGIQEQKIPSEEEKLSLLIWLNEKGMAVCHLKAISNVLCDGFALVSLTIGMLLYDAGKADFFTLFATLAITLSISPYIRKANRLDKNMYFISEKKEEK